ncbi:MAG: glycine zipper 2TM domain-containing protein [Erythrobacter sp.]|nr:glycine zipper 2TM domain-containing protein [Erythrobacter sp.]
MPKITKALSLAFAATGLSLAMPASAAVPSNVAPASAAPQGYTDIASGTVFEHGRKRHNQRQYYGRDRQRGYYQGYSRDWGQPVRRDTRIWRGRDNRYYCRKDDGTTGLLVGAGVGALLGHEVAGRGGDRTLGAILGGAAGALLGRSIDRSSTRCG